jgi:hypothetical protein
VGAKRNAERRSSAAVSRCCGFVDAFPGLCLLHLTPSPLPTHVRLGLETDAAKKDQQLQAEGLSLLGSWLAQRRSHEPRAIVSDYMEKAVQLLTPQDRARLGSPVTLTVFYTLAHYADEQFRLISDIKNSPEFEVCGCVCVCGCVWVCVGVCVWVCVCVFKVFVCVICGHPLIIVCVCQSANALRGLNRKELERLEKELTDERRRSVSTATVTRNIAVGGTCLLSPFLGMLTLRVRLPELEEEGQC